jgi:hypothetical protein
MRLLAIDPGDKLSAWVVIDTDSLSILDMGKRTNDHVLSVVTSETHTSCALAIEMVASYGMPVGRTVFETCVWIGRFAQEWGNDDTLQFVYRSEVKACLCKSPKANDSTIRQAIIDLYPATGGGARPVIGTKGQPGPLFGVSADIWAALAVAITETRRTQSQLSFKDPNHV